LTWASGESNFGKEISGFGINLSQDLKTNSGIMKTTIKLTVIILLCSLGLDDIHAQMAYEGYYEKESASFQTFNVSQDSVLVLTPLSSGSRVIQGGIGFGYMLKGGFIGMKGKFVSKYRWGTSLDSKFCSWRTKNLPSDYSPLFYPRDECAVFSLNLVWVVTRHGQNPRFSLELGPSLVRTDYEIITPNPDYDPNDIWHLSKYFRSNVVEQAFGLSMSMETEILLTSFMIMDFTIFANLNKLNSFLGIGLYFHFGDVKD
jgi:hypothetical protein